MIVAALGFQAGCQGQPFETWKTDAIEGSNLKLGRLGRWFEGGDMHALVQLNVEHGMVGAQEGSTGNLLMDKYP
eukprot:1141061-Pelagomonas_calceolata.AAC.1